MTTAHGAAAALGRLLPGLLLWEEGKPLPSRLSHRGRSLVLIAGGNPSWHEDPLLGHRLW